MKSLLNKTAVWPVAVGALVFATGAANAITWGELPTAPDVASFDINFNYVSSTHIFTAIGQSQNLQLPGSPTPTRLDQFGSYTLSANIDSSGNLMSGSNKLTVTGKLASKGFTSTPLLQGDITSFTKTADEFFFAFTITGGSFYERGYRGNGGTLITDLSDANYPGSFSGDFSTTSFGALADVRLAPDSGSTFSILGFGLTGLCLARRRLVRAPVA